jgi:5-methyltetrahydrofolate--homocysteine methyltransferase
MGANLQARTFDLTRDWMGHENACEVLNLSRPEVIQSIHESFLEVGCDAVETNTFNGSREDLMECDLADRTTEVNRLAAELARRACDKFETPDRPRYVIGSIGPGRKLLTLGMTDWATMEHSYSEQMLGLLQGGADVLLIETQQDMLASKCMITAANRAMHHANRRVPLMVQFSFDQDSGQQTLTGSDPSAIVATFLPYSEVDVLGVNCAFGPPELTETTRFIAENWPRFVSALPNAGLPLMIDGKTRFPMVASDS